MHVLFTTDGSEASERAIREAVRLLPLAGARATVLTIDDIALTWPGAADVPGALAPVSMLAVREPQAMQADLERAAELLRPTGATVATVVRQGDAATRILETAADLGVDLIVVGSHGRGALGRLVMGSVSTAVLHGAGTRAPFPAVLVTGRPPAQA